jgi:NapH/MauN family ferredoxin-type protein
MREKTSSYKRRTANHIRLSVLIAILVLLTVLGLIHQLSTGWRPAGVDALCPFGGVESLITVLSSGTMLDKIALSSFVLLVATILTALIFRRSFCGNICPLGTLQELSARLGKKVFGKRFTIPEKIDRYARYLKYGIFVVVVMFSVLLGELVFRPYDPWVAWQHLSSVELFSAFSAGLVILILLLLGSTLYDRFFCKYLCPMGGFLGIIGKIGYFRIKRNATTCINCNACTRVCPMNIRVAEIAEVTSSECINCNRCVNACPVEKTLTIEGKKKGRTTPILVLAATLAIFLAVTGIATVTGDFSWSVKGIEQRAMETGSFDPDTIKGSDLWKDIARLSGIPKQAFIEKFGLSEKEFDGSLRDWAHNPTNPREVDEVRIFVKEKMEK